MKLEQRYKLEALYNAGMSKTAIARELGLHPSNIGREIRKGLYSHETEKGPEIRYSADIGEAIHRERGSNKGPGLMIGNRHDLASYLDHAIVDQHMSPGAARAAALGAGYTNVPSISTIYNYLRAGVLLRAGTKHQWRPRKRRATRQVRVSHPQWPTITQRPQEANNRIVPGHWEIDLIVGPVGSKAVLLSMVDRSTRVLQIHKLPNKKAETIAAKISQLSKKSAVKYKSFTADNGTEFLAYDKLTKIAPVYYCHPYSSWEKGSVENANSIIRRFLPKGTNFAKISKSRIQEIENWINNYPRKILGWRSAAETYDHFDQGFSGISLRV